MGKCAICEGSTGFSGRYIENGKICGKCYAKIPYSVRQSNNLSEYNDLMLRTIIDEDKSEMEKKFEITSSYGNLVIDGVHGWFGVKHDNETDKFNPMYLTEIGITLGKPSLKNNNIFADVSLNAAFSKPRVRINVVIKKNAKCQSAKTQKGYEWNEPQDLSMFREIFNQMLNNSISRQFDELSDMVEYCQGIELMNARSLFMLDEDEYTAEELKVIKKQLLKAFHPDQDGLNPKYAQRINRAYDLLLSHIEGGKKK